MPEINPLTATQAITAANLVSIETLRRHRQLVSLQEWLLAQAPWRRTITRAVRQRLREAA